MPGRHDARALWLRPPGPVAPGLRIGLLGGSFNPAHEGHVHASEVALKRLGLDYVWWLVSPQNPLKRVGETAPLERRLERARKVARSHPRLRVTDLEAQMGTRYTIDTVTRLKRRFPAVRFVWLMGSDNLLSFHRWRNWQRLAMTVPIAIVTRPGTILAPLASEATHRFAIQRSLGGARSFAMARPPVLVVLDSRRNSASATVLRERGLGWPKWPVLN
jgi:nicotinate-nucleotide adenylyltransferase